jgi:hypothetical protein
VIVIKARKAIGLAKLNRIIENEWKHKEHKELSQHVRIAEMTQLNLSIHLLDYYCLTSLSV